MAKFDRKLRRSAPKPIGRGIAVAAERLYHECGFLKYRINGDVVDLTRPKTRDDRQATASRHPFDRRRRRGLPPPAAWAYLAARAKVTACRWSTGGRSHTRGS